MSLEVWKRIVKSFCSKDSKSLEFVRSLSASVIYEATVLCFHRVLNAAKTGSGRNHKEDEEYRQAHGSRIDMFVKLWQDSNDGALTLGKEDVESDQSDGSDRDGE